MRKFQLLTLLIAVLAASSGSQNALASTEPCDLTDKAAELSAIQSDTSLEELVQLSAEMTIRRGLFTTAVDCDQRDIAARVEAFASLPDNIKIVPAYSNILEELAKASKYYEERKRIIQQDITLWNLKNASRDTASWRHDTYLPLITWADNFLLWADNQQFLEKASGRLTQVSRVAFSLKLVNQAEINDLFVEAQKKFDTAISENDSARNALAQKRPLAGLTHTQKSLQALADTYDIFFALQEKLQEIVQ